jgi:hypothetical protein
MNQGVVLAYGLVIVGALLTGALIVCLAPDARVWWVLWPFLISLSALPGFANRTVPEKRPAPLPRALDD